MRDVHSMAFAFGCVVLVASAGAQMRGVEEAILGANDPQTFDYLGSSVAISGTTVLAGAPLEEPVGQNQEADWGAAYVFEHSGSTWTQTAKLVPPVQFGDQFFGAAVALEGDTAAIGSEGEHYGSFADAGAVYVYERSGTAWIQQARLQSSLPSNFALFGNDVDLDGDTLAVGIKHDAEIGYRAGAVEVFVRAGSTWTVQARLTASDADVGDSFGSRVALGGDVLLVSGQGWSSNWYIFERTGTTWTERHVIPGGWPLATDGTWVFSGRPTTNEVNVYTRGPTAWQHVQTLAPAAPVGISYFGKSAAAVDGVFLAVGARGDDAVAVSGGAVHLFLNHEGVWTEVSKMTPPSLGAWDRLGSDVDMADGRIVAGAPEHDVDCPGHMPNCQSGAAFVFRVEDIAPSFCDASDGSLASCPCANPGLPSTGCDNAQSTGGVGLEVLLAETAPQNRVVLVGSGYPPNAMPSSVVIRASTREAFPMVFGDGLRCVGVPVVRVGAGSAAGGMSTHEFGHGAGAGVFHYQLWLRNTPAMFCDPQEAFNLSNGRSLAW